MAVETYRTVTGREISLDRLSPAEARFLSRVREEYERSPTWIRFASWCFNEFQESGLPTTSVAFQICGDLEGRLGIAEGRVAKPDYRDYIADLIDEQYGSHDEFCKKTGVDPGQLGCVFAGKPDLSLPHLGELLRHLRARLIVKPDDELEVLARTEGAAEALAAVHK